MTTSLSSSDVFAYPSLTDIAALHGFAVNHASQLNTLTAFDLETPEIIPRNQRQMYELIGLPSALFERRVMMACIQENAVMRITKENHELLKGLKPDNRCACLGYDGIWTTMPYTPLTTAYGDCPQILVAGPGIAGIVHTNRSTLDKFILDEFIGQIQGHVDLKDLRFGFSPYLEAKHFHHTFLGMQRSEHWLDSGVLQGFEKGGWTLDLKKAATLDLNRLGVASNQIYDAGLCTYEMAMKAAEEGGRMCSRKAYETLVSMGNHDVKQGRAYMGIMLQS